MTGTDHAIEVSDMPGKFMSLEGGVWAFVCVDCDSCGVQRKLKVSLKSRDSVKWVDEESDRLLSEGGWLVDPVYVCWECRWA